MAVVVECFIIYCGAVWTNPLIHGTWPFPLVAPLSPNIDIFCPNSGNDQNSIFHPHNVFVSAVCNEHCSLAGALTRQETIALVVSPPDYFCYTLWLASFCLPSSACVCVFCRVCQLCGRVLQVLMCLLLAQLEISHLNLLLIFLIILLLHIFLVCSKMCKDTRTPAFSSYSDPSKIWKLNSSCCRVQTLHCVISIICEW